jgi:hypothetical protein
LPHSQVRPISRGLCIIVLLVVEYQNAVFMFKVCFCGSFGYVAVQNVGFWAGLAGEVLGSNFLSGQGK